MIRRFLMLTAAALAAACTSVDSTEHCVLTRYGQVVQDKMPNGLNATVFSDATCFPLTDQNFPQTTDDTASTRGETMEAQTSDPITLTSRVSVVYRYDPSTVVALFKEKRSQGAAEVELVRAIREGYRSAVASWTVAAVFSTRQATLSDSIRAHIQRKIGNRAVITNVYLTNIRVPEAIESARVEAARQAQLLDKAQKQREIAEAEAATALVVARSQADANALIARSYAENPALLQLKIAEAYSNGLARICSAQTQVCVVGGSALDALTKGGR